MGKRRDERQAALIEKAGSNALTATPMASVGTNASTSAATAISQLMGVNAPNGIMRSLARDPSAFGGALRPGYPFQPAPLDQGYGSSNRPNPRKSQYDVADNLNITKKLAQWNVLAAAAVQCDLYARAISIRTSDVTKMDWKWNVSKDAIETVMEDNNCGSSEASKIARKANMPQIVRLSEFWENPYPQSDRGWSEWITEGLWQILVYDGWPVHPAFNLGGDVVGFDTIDASTIKILLDNEGDFVRPPDPGFQQILFGFPRGEFVASPNKDVPNFLNGEYAITERDQLSYFVMNRRTVTPYGFSPVEQSLAIANIYLEREAWMMAEYKFGTSAGVYMETEAAELTLANLAGYERIYNDYSQGSTANRQTTRLLPPGFKPNFAPSITEKYKTDYDEHLIKRVAAFFGVAPSQFGIVARAGLGGGKGAGEAERDIDETVSSRPMNSYREDCVNSLSRRYLGANRSVVFTLSEDEGAQDEVEVSTAMKNYVSFGAKTLNDVRNEQGLPLFDMPEADVPFIATPTGPIYFTETLDAQLNPPKPPTPIIMQGNNGQRIDNNQGTPEGSGGGGGGTQEGSQGQKPQSKEEPSGASEGGTTKAGLKTDEAKAYREFISQHHSDEEIETLKAGLAPHPKLLKVSAEDLPSSKKLKGVAQAHSTFIRTALTAGVTGVAAAVAHALRLSAETPEAGLKQVARVAIDQNVTFDSSQAKEMLSNLYRDAGQLGSQTAADALGVDVTAGDR